MRLKKSLAFFSSEIGEGGVNISTIQYRSAIIPLQEKAYLALQEMIDNHEFALGTIYSETKLSQMLDISRTPLRSALNRMVQDGYIDVLPSRGFVLHEMTNSEFLDYVDSVCAIENFAVFRCIQNQKGKTKCLSKLEQIHNKMKMASQDQFAELNDEFHITLIQTNTNLVMSRNYHNAMHLMRTQHEVKTFNAKEQERIMEMHAELICKLQSSETAGLFEHINEHVRFEMIQK